MSKRIQFLVPFVAGLAVIGFYYFSTLNSEPEMAAETEVAGETEMTTEPEVSTEMATETETTADDTAVEVADDIGNPSLEITVSGEANGTIVLELFGDVAPGHVERIVALARAGAYDNVVFHRVIEGFMAQTGDVEFGKSDGDVNMAGRGGSDMPDLAAEFSDRKFERGTVGMARSSSPDSANSQFFIMFEPAGHLDGQYTIVGKVVEGLEILDAIKLGTGGNGAMVGTPDVMSSVKVVE